MGSIATDSTSALSKRERGGGRCSLSVSSVLSVSSSVTSDRVEVLLDEELLLPLDTLGLIDDDAEDEDEDELLEEERDDWSSSSSSDV